MKKRYYSEIVLCEACKGVGRVTEADPFDRNAEPLVCICGDCEGSGREIKKTVATYEPFKNEGK